MEKKRKFLDFGITWKKGRNNKVKTRKVIANSEILKIIWK